MLKNVREEEEEEKCQIFQCFISVKLKYPI